MYSTKIRLRCVDFFVREFQMVDEVCFNLPFLMWGPRRSSGAFLTLRLQSQSFLAHTYVLEKRTHTEYIKRPHAEALGPLIHSAPPNSTRGLVRFGLQPK